MTAQISNSFYQLVANLCKNSTEPMVDNLPGTTLWEWLQETDEATLAEMTPVELAEEWDSLNPENE